MGEPTGNYNIDIQLLADDLEKKLCKVDLDGGRRRGSPECLISKVKPQARRVDDSQYTPQLVLVGAYHHKPLDSTDQLAKWTALRRVLPDDGEQRASTLRLYLKDIAGVEDEARSYYEDRAMTAGWEMFVQMLLLDAWNILHIFNVGGCGASSGAGAGGEAAARRSGSAVNYIFAVRDVFYLLENQIPFFILEKVYELVHVRNSGEGQDQHTQTRTSSPPPQPPGATAIASDGGSGSSSSSTVVVDGFVRLLRSLLQPQGYSKVELEIATIRPCHLVHLLHMHFRPTSLTPMAAPAAGGDNTEGAARTAPATVYRWRGATQYHTAGVKFKSRPLDVAGDARCVLDVELRRLTLHVPTLTVDNNTWRILRNLMALEQNNPHLGSHVTAYCLFMSQLAGTASDVVLLVSKGVVVHFMGTDKEVADGFASLCRGVALDVNDARRNYLQPTWERMERWYNSRPINWMALLRRRHLSNPLVAIALLAAIAGLVCEVVQAVYAVKSYMPTS